MCLVFYSPDFICPSVTLQQFIMILGSDAMCSMVLSQGKLIIDIKTTLQASHVPKQYRQQHQNEKFLTTYFLNDPHLCHYFNLYFCLSSHASMCLSHFIISSRCPISSLLQLGGTYHASKVTLLKLRIRFFIITSEIQCNIVHQNVKRKMWANWR